MRCPTQPQSIQYLNWKRDTEEILKQHDHAFGNGQPPINTKPLTLIGHGANKKRTNTRTKRN